MADFPADIYTEPDVDVGTPKKLGPSPAWPASGRGPARTCNPRVEGPERQAFITDRNTLTKIADPTPNPLAAARR